MTDRFMDGYDDPWGPAGRYGGKLVNWMVQSRAGVSVDDLGEAVPEEKFNNEGEKQMEKIDWHKPLRAFKTPGHEVADAKVYTYKSGRQRVVWVDERVYPVDDQGRAVADVDYGSNWVHKGAQFVENVPEEEFFVGLRRMASGTYVLTDGGVPTTMGTMNFWKGLVYGEPHWIVDTRKSAEPPKAIEHDPEDWITVWFDNYNNKPKISNYTKTKSEAEASVSEPGEQVVRVRVTPAPVDTSRYIVLWREGPNQPWRINKFGDGRQEFTRAEVGFRAGRPNDYCAVKVRD